MSTLAVSGLIFVGAGIGALIRYAIVMAWNTTFPWGTLAVNASGSLLMGVVLAVMSRPGSSDPLRIFLIVGLLGGFTTFSTFSADFLQLAQSGAWREAFGYALATNIVAVVGCALAWWVTSRLLG